MTQRDGKSEQLWASKFMELLANMIYERRETSMYEKIKQLARRSALGIMFESIAHVKLTQSTKDFDLSPLHKKNARNPNIDKVSCNFGKPVVRLRSIVDIGGVPQGSYGLPITSLRTSHHYLTFTVILCISHTP